MSSNKISYSHDTLSYLAEGAPSHPKLTYNTTNVKMSLISPRWFPCYLCWNNRNELAKEYLRRRMDNSTMKQWPLCGPFWTHLPTHTHLTLTHLLGWHALACAVDFIPFGSMTAFHVNQLLNEVELMYLFKLYLSRKLESSMAAEMDQHYDAINIQCDAEAPIASKITYGMALIKQKRCYTLGDP